MLRSLARQLIRRAFRAPLFATTTTRWRTGAADARWEARAAAASRARRQRVTAVATAAAARAARAARLVRGRQFHTPPASRCHRSAPCQCRLLLLLLLLLKLLLLKLLLLKLLLLKLLLLKLLLLKLLLLRGATSGVALPRLLERFARRSCRGSLASIRQLFRVNESPPADAVEVRRPRRRKRAVAAHATAAAARHTAGSVAEAREAELAAKERSKRGGAAQLDVARVVDARPQRCADVDETPLEARVSRCIGRNEAQRRGCGRGGRSGALLLLLL